MLHIKSENQENGTLTHSRVSDSLGVFEVATMHPSTLPNLVRSQSNFCFVPTLAIYVDYTAASTMHGNAQ